MGELKISKLPDRTPVKIAIGLAPDLSRALELYAELYRDTYGEVVSIQDLIPAMLGSFLEGDRAFVQRRKQESAQ